MTERHVKLFRNGRNQAIRIPRDFELPGEDAIMRKEGNRLIVEVAPPRSLLALLATLSPIDEDFPLRELEADGLVNRKIYPVIPPKVEYSLTPRARTLRPVIMALKRWGEEHVIASASKAARRANRAEAEAIHPPAISPSASRAIQAGSHTLREEPLCWGLLAPAAPRLG